MKHTIKIHALSDTSYYNESIELSPFCPNCKVALVPNVLSGTVIDTYDEEDHVVFLLNYCPSCGECFISRHIFDTYEGEGFSFDFSAPKTPEDIHWDPIIHTISPEFVKIYNQANAAESSGLDQISGVGYRKALEFLIKDYLISLTTDKNKIKEIKKKFLGKCINEDIDNHQLQTVASRAAWLGNDQTHYEQRFNDKDISDLKRMIRLTVHWICLLKETEEAESIQPR